jgi:hypothetical protein
LNPSINTLLHVYDHTIQPIAIYGGELWGLANFTEKSKGSHLYDIYKDWEFEKINIKFYKYILGLNKRTTNLAVLAELGKFPAYISVVSSFFMYWHRVQSNPTSLLRSAYEDLVSPPTILYPYRAYIEILLSYGPAAKGSQLTRIHRDIKIREQPITKDSRPGKH